MNSTDNRDLLLDANNNLVFVNGDFQWARGLAGVVQECRIKLSMFRGEWFLDRTVGISYWQEILGAKPELAISALMSEFYEALMGVEDVVAVVKLSAVYNRNSRELVVTWAVRTFFGDSATQTSTI